MNVFELIDPAFAFRLTATLLHFLWQGCLIAVLAMVGELLLNRAEARWKYLLHLAALGLMIAAIAVTFAIVEVPSSVTTAPVKLSASEPFVEPGESAVHDNSPTAIPTEAATPFVENDVSPSEPLPSMLPVPTTVIAADVPPALQREPLSWVRYSAPYVTLLYFVCCGVMLVRLMHGTWGAHRLRRRSVPVDDVSLIELLRMQCHELGLRVLPAMVWCTEVSIPVVLGVLKPMILLPTAAATGLSPEQIQTLITHELAHIRRYDLLANLMQRLAEALLFFHPAVWFISRRLSNEREQACDELVLATGCERLRYADALVRMAELSMTLRDGTGTVPATSLAAAGANSSEFKRRVLKVLAVPVSSQLRPSRISLLLVLVSLILGVTLMATRLPINALAETKPPVSSTDEDSEEPTRNEEVDPQAPLVDNIFPEVIELFTPDTLPMKDVSNINDPEELLGQLEKGPRVSLHLMTGGGIFWQPGMPPESWQVTQWTKQFAEEKALDPRVRQLIKLGEAERETIQQRLATAKPAVQSHLALVLRSTGKAESVPVLIQALQNLGKSERVGRDAQSAMTSLAITSTLWELTGRRHHFTPKEWESWWNDVKPTFILARDRQLPKIAKLATKDRIGRLASELATQEQAARERLIVIGPAAVPHLLSLLNEELEKETAKGNLANETDRAMSVRLAWVIDELGATDRLPAKLRRDYFTQRLSDGGTYAGISSIDEDALCRALSHCTFADYCSIFLEADSQGIVQPHGKWPIEIYSAYCRRFSKIVPRDTGGRTDAPHWRKVIPAEDPSAEIAAAVPILVAALKDERAERRKAASKLAAAIGFCTTAKPETLIVALRDAWLAEADEKVRPEFAFAMCRFQTPFVVKEISNGLLSDRPEIVSDCAGLMDWIPIQLNDETRASFERLVELTRHENDKLRNRAVRSLRGKSPALLQPELPRLIQDTVVDIRKECAYALRDNPDPKFADILFQLAADADEQVRIEVIGSIGNLKHQPSMPRLVPFLRDKKVHGYAVSALASMGGKDSLPLMMEELKTGNDVGGMIYQHLRRLTGEQFEEKPQQWLQWWQDQQATPQASVELPAWGPEMNGLRARVVPVSSAMSAEAVELAQRVTEFETLDDVGLAVELENVSDKPVSLRESSSKQAMDWFGQFLFSINYFDADGKPISRPELIPIGKELEVVDGAPTSMLEPKQSIKMLLRPNRWISVLSQQPLVGKQRAVVKYRGTVAGDGVGILGDVVAPAVEFSVTKRGYRPSGAPAAQMWEEPKDNPELEPDITKQLVWGQPINGLRAALDVVPESRLQGFSHGTKPKLKLLVQNVSDKPVTLATFMWLSELPVKAKNSKGEDIEIQRAWYTGETPVVRVVLKPDQVVALDAGNLGLAVTKERADAFEHVTHRRLVAPSGKYTLQATERFGTSFQLKDSNGNVTFPTDADFKGDLTTGPAKINISNEVIEGEVVDAVTGKPVEGATVSFMVVKPKTATSDEAVLAHMVWGPKSPSKIYFTIPETPEDIAQRTDRDDLEIRWGVGSHPDYEVYAPEARIPLKGFFHAGPKTAREVLSKIKLIPKKKDEGASSTKAELRHGREIELVGVAYPVDISQSVPKRKVDGWWKADGSKLDGEPFKLAPLSVVPGKQKFVELAFVTRAIPQTGKSQPVPLVPIVLHGGLWFGTHDGRQLRVETWNPHGFMQHQFLAGFDDDSKPGRVAFYFSDHVVEEGGGMDLKGAVRLEDDVKLGTKQLLESLQLAGIEKSATETIVKLKPNGHFRGPLQLYVIAICSDGSRVNAEDDANLERLVFKTKKDVESLQLNVRPMTHRVDCENIALRPGQNSSPLVTVTPLDECFSIKFRKAGKTLGNLNEVRPQDLVANLKLLQPDLNNESGELIIDSQKQSAFAHAERVVKQLTSDGWKWPKITLNPIAATVVAAETEPPVSLEFLKPYPKLQGLSLDITESKFLEIVKQQELQARKIAEGEKITYHIGLGDDHMLIVMFDKDSNCSGIQRVRGENKSVSTVGNNPSSKTLTKEEREAAEKRADSIFQRTHQIESLEDPTSFIDESLEALKDSLPRVRQMAGQALGRGAPVWNKDQRIVAALITAIKSEHEADALHELVQAVGAYRDARAVEPLMDVIDRLEIFSAWNQTPRSQLKPEMIRGRDEAIRFQVAMALAEIGDRRGIPLLRNLLSPERPMVMEALGKMQDRDSVPAFLSALEQPSQWTQANVRLAVAAARALKHTPEQRAIRPMQKLLIDISSNFDDRDPFMELRSALCDAIATLGSAESAETLLRSARGLGNNFMFFKQQQGPEDENAHLVHFPAYWPLFHMGAVALPALIAELQVVSQSDRDDTRHGRELAAAVLSNLFGQGDLSPSDGLAATSALIAALQDRSPLVRQFAARSLGLLHSKEALPGLIQLADQPRHPNDQIPPLESGDQAKFSQQQRDHFTQRTDFILVSVGNALSWIGDERGAEAAAKLLKQNAPNVRTSAVFAVQACRHPQTVELLAALTTDAEASVRQAAVRQLGFTKNASAVIPLVKVLESEKDSSVRATAAQSLGLLGDRSAGDALAAALTGDAIVRRNASVSLVQLNDDRGLDAFRSLFTDPKAATRAESVQHMSLVAMFTQHLGRANWEHAAAREALLKALTTDTDSRVRSWGLGALRGTNSADAIAALKTLTQDSVDWVRKDALAYLADSTDPTRFEMLIAAMNDSHAIVRGMAASKLKSFDNPASITALTKALDDTDPAVREIAISSLVDLKATHGARAKLEALTEKDPNPKVRYRAQQALLTTVSTTATSPQKDLEFLKP